MSFNMFNLLAKTTINPNEVGIPVVNISNSTVGTLLNTVYFWAGIVAVIVIIIAGFIFVTSNGDANKISRAKQAILGSVIGLVVIMLAFVITQFVIRGVSEGV